MDILSTALGSNDRNGIVRGVGKGITQNQYFHKPKKIKQINEESNDIEKVMMAEKIKDLEAELTKYKKTAIESECPCDKQATEVEPVKVGKKEPKVKRLPGKKENKGNKGKNKMEQIKDGTSCKLAIGTPSNIVASGTIFDWDRARDNVLVSIDVVFNGDSEVPIPSKEYGNTLSQEIGSHILWPRRLVIISSPKKVRRSPRKLQKNMNACSNTVVHNLPIELQCLLRELKLVPSSIQINVPEDVFGTQHKCSILLDDVHNFSKMHAIANPCLDAYMMFLKKHLDVNKPLNMYHFMDSGALSLNSSVELRVNKLIRRLREIDSNQALLFPYNSGYHWSLIIMDLSKGCAFFIDSLRNRLHPDITTVLSRAFKDITNKKLTWKLIKMKSAPSMYSQDELDMVRAEWAKFMGSFILFAR